MKHYTLEHISIDDLIPYAMNSRTHSPEQVNQIAASIKEFGFTNPVLIDEDKGIIAGHGRVMAAKKLGVATVPCITLVGLSDVQKKAYVIADNKLALNAGWDEELLKLEIESLIEEGFDTGLLGFNANELDDILQDEEDGYSERTGNSGVLEGQFGIPPFSILDTRSGKWGARKRHWRDLIGDFGESREGTLGESALMKSVNSGVSLLDPVLAEIIVGWFGLKGGVAFDPFAGDTVFGYVSGYKSMRFQGIELREEQARLNQERCSEADLPCTYFCDSSVNMDKYIPDESVDLVFSCPPYADLEVYSDDERDLSNMSHDDFFKQYEIILANTFSKLKNNRFAVIVMGEVRDKKGNYIKTVPNTIDIMCRAGYKFYNELILINMAGTLPLRAGGVMRASRKVGKTHQNVLVFLKGDSKQANKDLGDIDMEFDLEDEN